MYISGIYQSYSEYHYDEGSRSSREYVSWTSGKDLLYNVSRSSWSYYTSVSGRVETGYDVLFK